MDFVFDAVSTAEVPDVAADAMLWLGSNGRVVASNPAASRVFGRQLQDQAFGAPIIRSLTSTHAGDILSRVSQRPTISLLTDDGGLHQFCVLGVPTRLDEDGTAWLVTLRDTHTCPTLCSFRQEDIQVEAMRSERARVAREVHDSAIQTLVATRITAQIAQQRLSAGEIDSAKEALGRLVGMTGQALQELRLALLDIRSRSTEPLSMVLARLTEELQVDAPRTRMVYAADIGDFGFGADVQHEVEHIVREALTNALRHAHARTVSLRALHERGLIHLTVQDDGIGMKQARAKGPHLGVKLMQERAKQIGASLSIRSNQGQGTSVELIIPSRTATWDT